MLPKAILFDLDDTILRFSDSGADRWREICLEAGPRLSLSPSTLFDAIRSTANAFWSSPERTPADRFDFPKSRRRVVKKAFESLGIDNLEFAVELADLFSATREEGIAPFPGAIETLKRLLSKGVRLAMVTNGSGKDQRRKIDRFQLEPYFEYILIEGEFGVGKPEPIVYETALNAVEAEPSEAWMVGDSLENEVAGPQRLGIYAVWRDNAGRGLPPNSPVKPDRIIRSIAELLP